MLPRHWLAAAAMAVLLSGCGGGSGQKVQPSVPQPPPDPAPVDTVEDILKHRVTSATAPVATSFGGDVAVCLALGCPTIDDIHVDTSIDNVAPLPDLSAFERLDPRRGIDRARRSYRQERSDDPVSFRAFGAWTDHGFFIVETSLSEESRSSPTTPTGSAMRATPPP